MLRALGQPVSFLGLLTGFLLAVVVHRLAQSLAARVQGDRWALRGSTDPRRVLDPFGAVAAAIGGTGWGRSVEITGRRQPLRRVLGLLAGPAVVAALGVAVLAALPLVGGTTAALGFLRPSQVLYGVGGGAAQAFVLSVGMQLLAVAALALIPLPPLTGWAVLDRMAPHSPGWDKTRYWLVDRNIGVVALLALLVLPLGGQVPLLLVLTDLLAGLVLGAIW